MNLLLPLLLLLQACSSIQGPTSARLKIETIEDKYEVNDCVEDWSIPQLSGLPSETAQKKINSFLMSQTKEKSCDHSEDVGGEAYSLKLVADKVFPNYLLIKSFATNDPGGPQPKISASCMVFDLNSGDKVEFESLLQPKYKSFVDKLVLDQLWDGKTKDAMEYKKVLSSSSKSMIEIRSHKVCPTGKGLVLMFSTAEIAPASYKNPEIQVSQGQWSNIFEVSSMTKELFGDFLE